MAPSRQLPSKSTRPVKSILKKSPTSSSDTKNAFPSTSDSFFPSSKRDKRRIKHEQLINKVSKSATKTARRRRPNKKLVTTLDALADALPDADDNTAGVAGDRPQDQVNIIKRKSMKSKPGAMKRREKVDKGERDRFAQNLAQMAAQHSSVPDKGMGFDINSAPAVPSTTDRWAALRGFISQTLEVKPELKAKT